MSKKNKDRKQIVSCGGAVWRSTPTGIELLLVKQFSNRDRWGIPKGHIHKDESHETCAEREVLEEAGVVIKLGRRLPDVETSYKNEDKTVISWLSTCVGSDVLCHDGPESEVADAKWFGIQQLPEIIKYQRPLIEAAVEYLTDNDVREA